MVVGCCVGITVVIGCVLGVAVEVDVGFGATVVVVVVGAVVVVESCKPCRLDDAPTAAGKGLAGGRNKGCGLRGVAINR